MNGGGNYGNRLDNRQRGNASQLLEKYKALARDAQQAGDRVTAEYYLQYAEHYYRVLGDYRDKQPEQNRQRGRDFYEDDANGFGDEAEAGDDDRGEARQDLRSDVRDDDREQREDDDNRGDDNRSWQGERPRERNRDNNRDPGREARRDDNRPDTRNENRERPERQDRQPWTGNRNGNEAPRPERGERPERRDRQEPRERRPEYRDAPRAEPRAPAEASRDDSPIPGLPGPATLRINRNPEPAPVAAPDVQPEAAAEAPKRRGRPRKVVADAAEG
jgi:hypothetical protein